MSNVIVLLFTALYHTQNAYTPSWSIGVSVPGYVLVIIGDSSIADWDRCGIYNGGQCLHCVVQLDNVNCAI